MKTSLILVVLFLTACSPFPHHKVPGLEGLHVTEHNVSCLDVARACDPGLKRAMVDWPLACTVIRFDLWTCDIHTCDAFRWFTLAHERQHCAGYAHGERVEKALRAWQEKSK